MKVYFDPDTKHLIVPYQDKMLFAHVPPNTSISVIADLMLELYNKHPESVLVCQPHELPTLNDDDILGPRPADNSVSQPDNPTPNPEG